MFILLSKSYLLLDQHVIPSSAPDQTHSPLVVFKLRDESSEPLRLQWTSPAPATDSTTANPTAESAAPTVICGCVSPTEDYFAICDDRKNLIVFNRQFEPICQYVVKRACVKILFTSNEKSLLTCDKAGDVYEFDVSCPNTNPEQPGKLLLGHCSMLLDFCMTPDCKYIISCDRDEKIRITHYPNTYNILAYCLGHNEFVSSVNLLDQQTLISGSGDGQVILWDFISGKMLFSFNCDENFKDSKPTDKKEKSHFPVKSITTDQVVAKYLAVSFYNQPLIYLFMVVRDSENVPALELIDKVSLDQEPTWMQFDLAHNNFLWVLGGFRDKSIQLLELKQNKLEKAICSSNIVDTLNESEPLSASIEKDRQENVLEGLFKHYYNNVELYYQRKMLRIEGENKGKRFI